MTCMYFFTLIFTVTKLNVYDCVMLILLLFANAKQRDIKNWIELKF